MEKGARVLVFEPVRPPYYRSARILLLQSPLLIGKGRIHDRLHVDELADGGSGAELITDVRLRLHHFSGLGKDLLRPVIGYNTGPITVDEDDMQSSCNANVMASTYEEQLDNSV